MAASKPKILTNSGEYYYPNTEKKKKKYEPVRIPAENVPIRGVWNRELTFPIHSNINPSDAMA